jgi:hypothetical protein
MEYTPEISAALDIYGEESTTVDENGHMLQIYSESKRIKSILADLFNNVLDIKSFVKPSTFFVTNPLISSIIFG